MSSRNTHSVVEFLRFESFDRLVVVTDIQQRISSRIGLVEYNRINDGVAILSEVNYFCTETSVIYDNNRFFLVLQALSRDCEYLRNDFLSNRQVLQVNVGLRVEALDILTIQLNHLQVGIVRQRTDEVDGVGILGFTIWSDNIYQHFPTILTRSNRLSANHRHSLNVRQVHNVS